MPKLILKSQIWQDPTRDMQSHCPNCLQSITEALDIDTSEAIIPWVGEVEGLEYEMWQHRTCPERDQLLIPILPTFRYRWPEIEGIEIYDLWSHMTDSQKLMSLIMEGYYDPISGISRTDSDNTAVVCCSCDKLLNEEADSGDLDSVAAELPDYSVCRHCFCTSCKEEFEIQGEFDN